MTRIFKVLPADAWAAAVAIGRFDGSADDHRDGFIHLSTADQLPETLARHFRGHTDLVLVAVDPTTFGTALKWETSRGGALFPHLYAPLPIAAATWTRPLETGADGIARLPSDLVSDGAL